jgi:hypothetical protein
MRSGSYVFWRTPTRPSAPKGFHPFDARLEYSALMSAHASRRRQAEARRLELGGAARPKPRNEATEVGRTIEARRLIMIWSKRD